VVGIDEMEEDIMMGGAGGFVDANSLLNSFGSSPSSNQF